MLTVSVIIPAYNADTTLPFCLNALLQQEVKPLEIIVVDDGSTDQTLEVAKGFITRGIRVISISHQGAGAARNRGVLASKGEIILFTDADCAPAPNWVDKMSYGLLEGIEKGKQDGVKVVGAKGVYTTSQTKLLPRFIQLEFSDRYQRLLKEDYLEFVDTYSAAYLREVLIESGGFNPKLPGAVVEDAELSWRLAKKGYRMVFLPEAKVRHLHSQKLSSYFRRKYKIGYWRVVIYQRYPGRVAKDPHSSQNSKIQMALLPLGLLCLAFKSRKLTLPLLTILFYLTTLSFLKRSWRTDRLATLASLYYIPVKTVALTTGAVTGIVVTLKRKLTGKAKEVAGAREKAVAG